MRAALAAAALALLLSGCSAGERKLTRTIPALDTIVTVTLYSYADPSTLDRALDLCRELEPSLTRPVSANAAAIPVIEEGLRYGELTGGMFDITIGRVTALWDFKAETAVPPDPAALAAALATVGYEQARIADGVLLMGKGGEIDLGGIAKGWIADRMADLLRAEGASGVVDLGGNIVTVGENPDAADGKWRVAVQKPFGSPGEYTKILAVGEVSVVTSGVYERYFEYGGKRYHHIINPRTGQPAETGLLAVTVVSERSVDGDALSTSAFLLGAEAGAELIRGAGASAVFVLEDGSVEEVN
ncbi:MAG: FAD:protein FMN transferase [Clostridiales bacterium]|nr:FAD:protein FMN transferase [Clostridiales bacterium]